MRRGEGIRGRAPEGGTLGGELDLRRGEGKVPGMGRGEGKPLRLIVIGGVGLEKARFLPRGEGINTPELGVVPIAMGGTPFGGDEGGEFGLGAKRTVGPELFGLIADVLVFTGLLLPNPN